MYHGRVLNSIALNSLGRVLTLWASGVLFLALAEPRTAMAGAPAQVAANQTIPSFEHAKKIALDIYRDHRLTLYSGCTFDRDKRVDAASCGYRPRKESARAHRIEWEHVVPAEAFGRAFVEWRRGHAACVDRRGQRFSGRNCARKVNAKFRYMEADLYNLYPEIGEINALRANFSMAELPGETRLFGACDVEIVDKKFEPRPAVRGDIARTYLYMDSAYPHLGLISQKNRQLFAAWNRQDPVEPWECERARRIARLQGNINPFVEAPCRQAGL